MYAPKIILKYYAELDRYTSTCSTVIMSRGVDGKWGLLVEGVCKDKDSYRNDLAERNNVILEDGAS